MRERHWKSLMEDVGKTFDPHADGFTLEIVLELELEHHSDIIADLSQAAHASQSQTCSYPGRSAVPKLDRRRAGI